MNRYRHLVPKILLIMLFICLAWGVALAASPPLVPFESTGDLYVLDDGSGSVLRITPQKAISVEVPQEEIRTTLGVTATHDIQFRENGIAVGEDGSLYFSENSTRSILRKAPGGPLQVLVSKEEITALTEWGPGETPDADPEGLAFGSDGMLYVNENHKNAVLRVDPTDPDAAPVVVRRANDFHNVNDGITSVGFHSAIIGAEEQVVFVGSDGNPKAIYRINLTNGEHEVLARGNTFGALQSFITRAQDGTLIIADSGKRMIHQVNPANGEVSPFLSNAQLTGVTGPDPNPIGGLAFDSSGNFYVADETIDGILRFDPAKTGERWVTSTSIMSVTGVEPQLTAGIAFGVGTQAPPGTETETPVTATPEEATATPVVTATVTVTVTTEPILTPSPSPTPTLTTTVTATPELSPTPEVVTPTATPQPGEAQHIHTPFIMRSP